MPDPQARREETETLLKQADQLEDRLARWQQGSTPSPSQIRKTQREYQDWYSAALASVPEDERDRFRDMYEGGTFTPRIRAFLGDPLRINPFFDENQPTPLIDRWQHPYERVLRDNLMVQRELLVRALHAVADPAAVLDELTAVFRRLPDYLGVYRHADRETVPAPNIHNEADLQVVMHAVLRLLFEDVRAEDPVPQHAGGSSRVDFLLRDAGVIIETKMTRPSLTDRALGEELLVDWGRYPRHPDCRAILAVVYDPERRITNATALEQDLSQDH